MEGLLSGKFPLGLFFTRIEVFAKSEKKKINYHHIAINLSSYYLYGQNSRSEIVSYSLLRYFSIYFGQVKSNNSNAYFDSYLFSFHISKQTSYEILSTETYSSNNSESSTVSSGILFEVSILFFCKNYFSI